MIFLPMPSGYPMTTWHCPHCGEPNIDFCDCGTHCAHCGRVVWVLGQDQGVVDEKWHVPAQACGNCGAQRAICDTTIVRCWNCGDDEIDLTLPTGGP